MSSCRGGEGVNLAMKKLVLKLFLVALIVHCCAGRAVAQPPPEIVGWWEWAITAAHASIASVRSATIAPGLNEMPEVKSRLNQRASDVNQRAIAGNLKGQELYPKIPGGVRLAGPKAILEYLNKHEVSHIQSVKHHPELAAKPDNLVFEPLKWNRARGSSNMKLLDKVKVRFHNIAASIAGGRRIVLTTVAKGGAIGALVELPVTATVETLNVVNQRKTANQAIEDGAQKVGVTALAGGVTAGALTMASTFGFTVGAPVLVPLAVVGGSAYIWVSSDRVWNALDNETRAVIEAQLVGVQGKIRNSTSEWRDRATKMRDQASKMTERLKEHIYATITTVTERE